jgi:hypothetical protein
VQALIAAEAQDTVYTDAFSVGWDAPHRVLRSCIAAAEAKAMWWVSIWTPILAVAGQFSASSRSTSTRE